MAAFANKRACMIRRFLSKLCLLPLAAAVLLPSCAGYKSVFAPPSPPVGTRVKWPGSSFKEVRAYCYDYTAEKEGSFFIGGRMHKGVMDPAGVVLSAEQVRRLLDALTVSRDKQERTPCYKPHHAFVFYDGSGKPAAVFEMCFGCNRWVETPDGLPEYIGYAELWNLCRELGLPLGEGNAFYTESCGGRRAGEHQSLRAGEN